MQERDQISSQCFISNAGHGSGTLLKWCCTLIKALIILCWKEESHGIGDETETQRADVMKTRRSSMVLHQQLHLQKMSNKTENMDFHNIRLCSKYLILRNINAHFEFDDSSPSQDPGTGRASINIWELRRPAVRSQRRLRSSGLCIHNPATDSCLTSVFTQDLKGSRTWGWWITGRWFRRLFCQQRKEDSVRARAEVWLDYPDILGGTGGAVEGGQAGKFPQFLSQCTQTSLERRLLQVSGLTAMLITVWEVWLEKVFKTNH